MSPSIFTDITAQLPNPFGKVSPGSTTTNTADAATQHAMDAWEGYRRVFHGPLHVNIRRADAASKRMRTAIR